MKSPISLALALLFVASCAEAQTTGGGQGGAPGPAANASNLIGCVYIAAGVAPDANRPQVGLQCDASGNLKTTGGGGGGGSNAAAGLTGSAVPTSAGYTGYNSGGNLVGVSSANPFPVNIVSGAGGGGAVYGPTAVGTAAANPPVLTGGTLDGTATGAVQVWKIISGVGQVAVPGGVSITGGSVGLLAGSQNIGSITNVTGTVSLPTGASTAANQATEITSLATIATNTSNTSSVGVTPCTTANAACVANNYQLFTNQGSTATSTTLPTLLGGGWLVDYSVGTFTSYVANVTGPNGTLTQAFSASVAGKQCITIGNGSSFNSVITSPTGFYATLEYVGTCPAATQTLIQATASVPITIATGATTQIVALAAGKSIYVTGWNVVAAGTANFSLVYGTGTNCGTGTTALTGVYNLTAQSGLAFGGGLGPVLVTPVGQALCEVDSTTVQMSGSVAYAQQ